MKEKHSITLLIIASLIAAFAFAGCGISPGKVASALSGAYGTELTMAGAAEKEKGASSFRVYVYSSKNDYVFSADVDEKDGKIYDRYIEAYYEKTLDELIKKEFLINGMNAASRAFFDGYDKESIGTQKHFSLGMSEFIERAGVRSIIGGVIVEESSAGFIPKSVMEGATGSVSEKTGLPLKITITAVRSDVFLDISDSMAKNPDFSAGDIPFEYALETYFIGQ